ncbi:MAG: tetratricopeptide repeat protein [Treponema sp.]|nr:tetratricopeptide repeat protein [Treponema sp.]
MKNNSLLIFLFLVILIFSRAGVNASDGGQWANEALGINDKPLEIGINKLRGENNNDNDMEMTIERLENRIEELANINEKLGYRVAELRINNYAWIIEMIQLINANNQLRERINELEKLTDGFTGLVISSEELRNTAYELLNDNIGLTHDNELLRNKNIELEAENNELKSEIEEMRTGNEELRIRLDELRRWASAITEPLPVMDTVTAPEPLSPQPPVLITQAPEQTEQLPLSASPIEEIPSASEPPAQPLRPDYPSGPPTRVDSILQMGMTPHESDVIFSRIVRANVGQILEIPFRGNGWVYLGELASRRGIVYSSRRNDTDGQSFVFSLDEAGTYVLKFYRQDFIRNFIINDHVQVIVGEAPAAVTGWFNPSYDRGRVIAQPRWPSALEEAQIISGRLPSSEPVISGIILTNEPSQSTNATQPTQNTASAAQGTAAVQNSTIAAQSTPSQSSTATAQTAAAPSQTTTSPSTQTTQGTFSADPYPGSTPVFNTQPTDLQSADSQLSDVSDIAESAVIPQIPSIPPEVLLQSAHESFNGGNIASALTSLAQYMDSYPAGSDEALWLLGQSYEANSPNRDILRSLDYYRRLTNDYPQSERFEDARRRISYLERFYITIQ